MEQIHLTIKQAHDFSWMKSLQEHMQYEFLIRLTAEWALCENEAYDMICELAGRFIGSTIVLEQHKLWVAHHPQVVMEWLPNLQLQEEKYYLGKLSIPRVLGLLLEPTKTVCNCWRFQITDVKEA